MNRTAYLIVMIVGILTILSFFPHAFLGMQEVLEHIEKGEIQQPAANGMQMIWLYSSIMMLVSGLWLLVLAKHIYMGSHTARLEVLLLGIGLTFFGLGCAFICGTINEMIIFTFEGLALVVATTFFYKKAEHIIQDKDE